MTLDPWTFTVVAIAGWMNRRQQEARIPRTKNRTRREKPGRRRIVLNDAQECRLATAAMKLGRDLPGQFGTLFSPSTLLRRRRGLVARNCDGSGKRDPKPKKANSVRKLVLQMAEQDPSGDSLSRKELA